MPQWHVATGIALLKRCFLLDFRVFSLCFVVIETNDPI